MHSPHISDAHRIHILSSEILRHILHIIFSFLLRHNAHDDSRKTAAVDAADTVADLIITITGQRA